MPTPVDKKIFREVSERIERAIEAYGAGQYDAALSELEAALEAQPDHPRARELMGWVKDLSSGKRKLPGPIDEDTLQAVNDALGPDFAAPIEEDTEKTREKRRAGLPESPWDPVPLTPSGREPPSTLLGLQHEPRLLTPSPKSKSFAPSVMEDSGQHTREWKSDKPTTGKDMPPLDVPELTDEQVQELLALDGAPALDLPAAEPRLETVSSLGLSADPLAESRQFVELEAEPTPEPHRNPLSQPTVPLPPGARKKDATTPDGGLPPVSAGSGEFDTYDLTPTRERRDLLKALVEAPAGSGINDNDELQLLPPLEAPRELAGNEPVEDGTNPTNPFIGGRLAQYASSGTQPKIDDLPLPPGRDTGRTEALEEIPGVAEAIERGDPFAALDAAERWLADTGGLETERARMHHYVLEQVYAGCIGPLERIPTHGQPSADLDPRAAFLLSRFDGMSTAEDVLDISGMPRLEALRLLAVLIWRGAVQMK